MRALPRVHLPPGRWFSLTERRVDRGLHPRRARLPAARSVDLLSDSSRDTDRDRDTASHTRMVLSLYHVSYLIRDGPDDENNRRW